MNWYKIRKLAERSLYHGTIVDNAQSIAEVGIVPQLGQFVKDAYESDYNAAGVDLEEEMTDLSFATDKANLYKAVTAMTHHIANKLGKGYHDVSLQDIRNHGLLVKVKGEPGSPDPPSPWEQRPEDDDREWDMMRSERGLNAVEPGDYYSEYPTGNIAKGKIQLIRGSGLIKFLRRYKLI